MLRTSILSICTLLLLYLLSACTQQPASNIQRQTAFFDVDTIKINRLIAKGKIFKDSNIDSLPKLIKQLYSSSNSINSKKGQIYAEIYEAYYYWMRADHDRAMHIVIQSLADAEKWKLKEPLPKIYSIMANLHKETGNYNAAFDANDKGLAIARVNRDTAYIISLLGLKAMFVHGYNNVHNRPDNENRSLNLEFEGLAIAESQPKYEQMRIGFYNNISQAYIDTKQYDKTLFYANKAVVLANKYHQPRSLTYSYCWIGTAYFYMGQQDKGIVYLNNAIAITRQIALPYRQMELYKHIYQCYTSAKNYERAIACLTRYSEMRDSLQVAKNEKQISELQIQYESVKKDKQIADLNEQNKDKSRIVLWSLLGLSFFILLMMIILFQYFVIHRNNKLIKTNNQTLNEAMLKIAHIQSHHIRKPLASILGLMNIIKAHNYEPDKEVLMKMDSAAQQLDTRIREVITHTETDATYNEI